MLTTGEKLPVLQRTTYKKSNGSEVDITTAGDKWATFEAENFAQTSQPLYVILNNDKQLINHPVGYTPDPKEYLKWLSCGKETFANKSIKIQGTRIKNTRTKVQEKA